VKNPDKGLVVLTQTVKHLFLNIRKGLKIKMVLVVKNVDL